MVSFFSVRNKEQENNNASSVTVTNDHGDPCFKKNPSSLFAVKNNPSSSSVEDVTDDDRVCLHFSVGDPCCLSCDHQQQITTKKKRKRPQQQQQTLKNKKTRIINWEEEEDDHSICLHLLLGSSSCIPTCLQTNNNIVAAADDDHHHHHDQWEIKKVLEQSDVCHHLCRLFLKKELAQKSVIPFLLGGAEAAQTKDGILVQVRDADTHTLHSLVFKLWISAKSHTFTKTWVKDFVVRRQLKKGDEIGLHWDQDNYCLEFSVLSRAKSDISSELQIPRVSESNAYHQDIIVNAVPINMVLPSEGSTMKRKISTSKKKKGSKLVRE